jgi:hypothetical protein
MTSMAAALAATLPAAPIAKPVEQTQQAVKVPQRMEGVVDVDASRDVESVQLSSLVRVEPRGGVKRGRIEELWLYVYGRDVERGERQSRRYAAKCQRLDVSTTARRVATTCL